MCVHDVCSYILNWLQIFKFTYFQEKSSHPVPEVNKQAMNHMNVHTHIYIVSRFEGRSRDKGSS